MNRIIMNRWYRWSIYVLLGVLFKFSLDVVYSLLYRNYALFQPFADYLFAIVLAVILMESLYYVRVYLDGFAGWEANPFRRYYLQWILSFTVAMLVGYVIRWPFKLVFTTFYYVRLLDELIILLMLTVAVTIIVTFELGLFLLKKWRFSLAELERFKKENAEFQFESLRAQVNPHFLFNSLNTLSSLIYEDKEKAELFIRELSDVYRYILENRGRELVPLDQELRVARSYIYLVQLRFEENLAVGMHVPDENLGMMIAPLTLQLLIENAVKHNVISRKRPLQVDIRVEDNTLVVRNNLQRKEVREYSSQLGLKNIRSRYAFLTDKPMEVLETDQEFVVRVPLIQKS